MEIQWPLVFFTLLSTIGCGAFLFVTGSELLGRWEGFRKPLIIIAIISLIIGGVASTLHLGHPERMLFAFSNLKSGIAQEALLFLATIVVVFLYSYLYQKQQSKSAQKILSVIGFLLSLIYLFVLGKTYVIQARPAWNTWLLPFVSIAAGIVFGSFILYFLVAYKGSKKDENQAAEVNKIALFSLIVEAFLIGLFVLFLLNSPDVGMEKLFSSEISLLLWGGVVLIGLLIPIALTVWKAASKQGSLALPVSIMSLLCVIVGGVTFRSMHYILGELAPLFK